VHRGALDDPRVEIRIGDGFAELRKTNESFDVIIMDLTDPVRPAEALYTADSFARPLASSAPTARSRCTSARRSFTRRVSPKRCSGCARRFAIVRPYFVHVPLYGANWGMACASQRTDPEQLTRGEVESACA
jgi:spermidine synthase